MQDIDQIITHVATHLGLHGSSFSLDGKMGMYRNHEDKACSVGCLMRDDPEAISAVEGMSVRCPEVLDLLCVSCPTEMLIDLQEMHDNLSPHHWPTALEGIRSRYVPSI